MQYYVEIQQIILTGPATKYADLVKKLNDFLKLKMLYKLKN